jgi:pSer/pThr/pTyr-binding forkhead associated (FHA) protein
MPEDYIVTVTLPGTPEHFSRVCSGAITVGRSPDADIQLIHPMVSRRHAELSLLEDGSFRVSDLGSSNGTVVNDELLHGDSRQVRGQAIVQLGPYMLQLAPSSAVEADTFMASKEDIEARTSTTSRKEARVGLDRARHDLLVDGRAVVERLTGLEYRLLEVLTDAEHGLVENQELGDAVWGRGLWDPYMLHNLVRRVRRKLEEKGLDADQIIVGVPRSGYRLA